MSSTAVCGLASCCAVAGWSLVSALRGRGAPFVWSSHGKLQALFRSGGLLAEHAPRRPRHLVDLGSGEGSVVRAAVRQGGFARATGYETNPFLLGYSRLRSLGRSTERHHLLDWRCAPLGDADVVYIYGIPPVMPLFAEKCLTDCARDALVVSNGYPLPRLHLIGEEYVRTPSLSPDASSHIYVYRLPEPSAPTVAAAFPDGAGTKSSGPK